MKQTVEDTIIKVIDLFGENKIVIKNKKEVELLDFLARDFLLPEKRLPKELSENDILLSRKVAVEAQLGKHVEISKVIDKLSNANENVKELTRIIMCNKKDQAVAEEKLKSLENEITFYKIEQELKANKLLSLIEQLAPLSQKNVKRAIQRRETKYSKQFVFLLQMLEVMDVRVSAVMYKALDPSRC